MTKKLFSFFVVILFSSMALQAQQYDVLDQVKADVRKCWGMEGPHRLDEVQTSLTKAPKGYKPFYVSHYGRHGSRYAWSTNTYKLLHKSFVKAEKLGVLTPFGKDFAARYEAFYKDPMINTGDLVPMGYEQHHQIGEYVYNHFPQVFKGSRKVDALASTAQRCIVSMSGFVTGLTKKNGALEVTQASNHLGMCIIAPPSAPEGKVRHFEGEDAEPSAESVPAFIERMGVANEVLSKLFTDYSFIDEYEDGKMGYLQELWEFVSNYHNYEPRPLFDDLFDEALSLKAWEVSNYFSYYCDLTQRYSMFPLLEDIIAKADEAIGDPSRAAHLRFGHDYIVEGLATLLNLNSCGTVVPEAEQAKYWFQNYNVPMAATLLFVFYKNKKNDVLFKLLWNENEAVLPQLTPVEGPYYRWNDFVSWCKDLMAAHPEIKS